MSDVSLPNTIAPPSVSTAEVQGNDEALRDYVNSSAWVDSDRLASGAALGNLGDTRGKSIIATEEARTNTAYGTLTTPDQVTGVVVPTDGLLCVSYSALWKNATGNAGRAAIFIGSNQLKVQVNGASAPATEAAVGGVGAGFTALASCPFGLVGNPDGTTGEATVTTGTALGAVVASGGGLNLGALFDAGVTDVTEGFNGAAGGVCFIDNLAAGTYTVSVQFKSSSGAVTVRERKLRVWTMSF